LLTRPVLPQSRYGWRQFSGHRKFAKGSLSPNDPNSSRSDRFFAVRLVENLRLLDSHKAPPLTRKRKFRSFFLFKMQTKSIICGFSECCVKDRIVRKAESLSFQVKEQASCGSRYTLINGPHHDELVHLQILGKAVK